MNGGLQPMGGTGSTVGRGAATSYPASGNSTFGSGASGSSVIPSVGPNNTYSPAGGSSIPAGAGMGSMSSGGAAGAGFSTPPSLSEPPLYPPAAPDNRAGPVMPPGGSGPLAPTNYR
jgi:hypothetical protein